MKVFSYFIAITFISLLGVSSVYALGTTVEMDVNSGTGFFVTPRHVVTNQHVVDGCEHVMVRGAVEPTAATIIGTDAKMDLALLRTESASPRTAYLRSNSGLRAGDRLNIIGYPEERGRTGQYLLKQAKVIDPQYNFEGITSILFTDAVEHGNSGGPLLDYAGNVIGVIVGKLSYFKRHQDNSVAEKPYEIRGVAIGLPILKQFLRRFDVFITETSSYDIFADPKPDQRAKQYTVNVLCVKDVREYSH